MHWTTFTQVVHITYMPNIYMHTHTFVSWIYLPQYHISLCPQGPPSSGPLSSGPLSSGAIAGVVLGGLVFLIVLAMIAVCVCALVYGYRHPTSKIGLFMIEVCLYDVCVCTEQYVKSVRFANRHATSLVEISTLLVLLGVSSCRLLCV